VKFDILIRREFPCALGISLFGKVEVMGTAMGFGVIESLVRSELEVSDR
jgi:hypothetical protein